MIDPRFARAVRSVVLTAACAASGLAAAEQAEINCPKPAPKVPEPSRSEVYKDTPFKAGESATYEVSWAGLKAGYATLEVRAPIRHPIQGKPTWHRVFHVSAATGDWFKAVFVAKEEMQAISRPWDFGVSHFYMEQNEGKMFSRPFIQKKWLEFDQEGCQVNERIQKPNKPEDKKSFELSYGSIDALSVIYNLRTRTFKIGKKERAPVYTSEKNWWLEADPVAFETITVPAGTYKTVKLKLQTYIGKDLQQKGDVHAWIATDTPERHLVQVQGEIAIGSVWIKLHQFKPGS